MLHGASLLAPSRPRTALHIYVCYACALGVLRQLFIVGAHPVGKLGDDVPGVQQAGEPAEYAEQDVDDRVGGADATFDPDSDWGEEDGDEAEEDV